jgi:hypothetical protein
MVDASRIIGKRTARSDSAKSKRKIDVLEIGKETFVKAADRLERICVVKGCRACRTERWCGFRQHIYRKTVKVVEREKRAIGGNSCRIDETSIRTLEQHASNHLSSVFSTPS